ncbi:MAG: DUF3291 domain-containing protein [Chloroflexota bacterium]
MSNDYHIAQVNIARMLAPIDSNIMAGFVARLDEINALADQAEGFVWRLQSDDGNATDIRVFDDDMLIVNLSVWESVEALHAYTYKTDHAQLIKGRKQWFSQLGSHHMAIWYIPAGQLPTTDDARARLEYLNAHGATPESFTFAHRFTLNQWLATQSADS